MQQTYQDLQMEQMFACYILSIEMKNHLQIITSVGGSVNTLSILRVRRLHQSRQHGVDRIVRLGFFA